MRSYLMSWLAKRYGDADAEAFARDEPHDWIVWEAGPWRPPSRGRETILARPGMGLNSGESLAIALVARDGKPSASLGRASECDLVIDDATLSRSHMRLERGPDGRWVVLDLGSSNGTRVDGVSADAKPVPLRSGSAIQAGNVRLTFYDGPGLWARLRGK